MFQYTVAGSEHPAKHAPHLKAPIHELRGTGMNAGQLDVFEMVGGLIDGDDINGW